MFKISVNSLNDFIYAADQQQKEVNTGGNLNSVKAQSCNPGSSHRAVLHTDAYAGNIGTSKGTQNWSCLTQQAALSNVFLSKTVLLTRRFQG